MSEKLVGVRCYWNVKNLYSRQGNLFYPPAFFTENLPSDFELDGELFTKRDDFQNCVSIVRKQGAAAKSSKKNDLDQIAEDWK